MLSKSSFSLPNLCCIRSFTCMAQGSINYSVFTRVASFFTTLAFGACGANIALIAFRTP